MPCHDERGSGQSSHLENGRIRELEERNDLIARMLCRVLRLIEKKKLTDQLTPNTRKWWKEHKAADDKRMRVAAAERKRKEDYEAARAKLTAKERKILGV